MRPIKYAFWGALLVLALLWFAAEPLALFQAQTFIQYRAPLMQLTGVLAIGSMSIAMMLAVRPRWPERWLGGLDKMYRMHKWLGISALSLAILHWFLSNAPKWASQLGLIEPRQRAPRPPSTEQVQMTLETFLRSYRKLAETVGEWTFYAAVILICLALIRYFPYRLFYKTHRLLALAYLALVFHTVVLLNYADWSTPLGIVMALMLILGTYSAIILLFRRAGTSRQVMGQLTRLQAYPGVKSFEMEIELPESWPGHKPGQFAFIMPHPSEGPHPFTIASDWDPSTRRIVFITKELGDYTNELQDRLTIGQNVRVEGPYGCFTFDDDCKTQIWVGGGIGISPFIGEIQRIAREQIETNRPDPRAIYLFHSSSDYDEVAFAKLADIAKKASINLTIMIDSQHGYLTGDKIRQTVPQWKEASIWFCGPLGFGDALSRDFAQNGFDTDRHFHREFFSMR